MQTLDWSDLQVFLAVARAGQLTRAGSLLGVNGTTVARRIRRLEQACGSNLFEQTREGQILTEAGERLLTQVETMAGAIAGVEQAGSEGGAGLSGILRISVAEGFGTWFLAPRAPDFALRHPRLTLDLVASSGFLSLSKREADMAVTLSRPRAGPVIARKLSDYSLQMFAAPAYLAECGQPERPADLAVGHRLVGYIPDLIYAPELRYLDEIQPGLAPHLRSSSINAQHRLVAAGAGIGVLPSFIGRADPGLRAILPERRIVRSFWLVTHKDTHQLARVRAGRSWILDLVQHHGEALLGLPG